MKIAFVGKGGSGKSTLAALFTRYLQIVRRENVLAIDADLNMNLAGLLGVRINENNVLASPAVQSDLRAYLKGSNTLIADPSSFLPTTPPGSGSSLIRQVDEPALRPYALQVSEKPVVHLLTVGSYGKEEIGQACYHTHLFMAENILSHTTLPEGSHVVCDMVAGTDAFAYSLHLQFDAIVLIAEPTPESAQVCNDYFSLAREAGIDPLVHMVANKIEDEEDLRFIREKTGRDPMAVLSLMPMLKKVRQQEKGLGPEKIDGNIAQVMQAVYNEGMTPSIPASVRMTMLCALHEKLIQQDWVKSGYGDVAHQIDRAYLKEAG